MDDDDESGRDELKSEDESGRRRRDPCYLHCTPLFQAIRPTLLIFGRRAGEIVDRSIDNALLEHVELQGRHICRKNRYRGNVLRETRSEKMYARLPIFQIFRLFVVDLNRTPFSVNRCPANTFDPELENFPRFN